MGNMNFLFFNEFENNNGVFLLIEVMGVKCELNQLKQIEVQWRSFHKNSLDF